MAKKEQGHQEWIDLKTLKTIEYQAAKEKLQADKESIQGVTELNFSKECREAYFPSLTWRKL